MCCSGWVLAIVTLPQPLIYLVMSLLVSNLSVASVKGMRARIANPLGAEKAFRPKESWPF